MATRPEFYPSYKEGPKFKSVSRRPRRAGGVVHSELKRRQHEEDARIAQEEIVLYQYGEPSTFFFPSRQSFQEDVVAEKLTSKFVPETAKSTGDLAKKRGVIINTLLQEPDSIPQTPNNLSFIERHFPRIIKFAKTLKNKGRLHPGMGKILEPELSSAESSVSS